MLSLDASQPLDQALQDLSLDDVWRFYLEPSLYGREVYTLGGMRGPSLCYFVPYLSAIQVRTWVHLVAWQANAAAATLWQTHKEKTVNHFCLPLCCTVAATVVHSCVAQGRARDQPHVCV